MRIVLLRHGPAGSRGSTRREDDAQRALTERGVERTRHAISGLKRALGEDLTTIATSPLARCTQTAELARSAFGLRKVEILDELAPGGSYRAVAAWLGERSSDSGVLLVGHEPELGKLAGVLLFGAPRALPLGKAGACRIEFTGAVEPGAGRLEWFLSPRLLRRLRAGKKKGS